MHLAQGCVALMGRKHCPDNPPALSVSEPVVFIRRERTGPPDRKGFSIVSAACNYIRKPGQADQFWHHPCAVRTRTVRLTVIR